MQAARLEGESPETRASLKEAYRRAGIKGYWQRMLVIWQAKAKQQNVPLHTIARIYSYLGERDRAFELLEKMYAEHSPHILSIPLQPGFYSLRSDPRYRELLSRIELPDS